MKTLADLKRALVKGRKLILVSRFGKPVNQPRQVISVQSNGVWFRIADDKDKLKRLINDSVTRTWLDFPKARLLEFTENGFKIYTRGERPLTEKEQQIMDNEPKDAEQERIDMLSDGNTMFRRKKRYYEEQQAEHLFGTHTWRGMSYRFHTKTVLDDRVKGDLILEYTLC